jgi:hypothetical protein
VAKCHAFSKALFTWATRKKVDPNLSSGRSLVVEIAIVTQSNNPAHVSNVSENPLCSSALTLPQCYAPVK